MNLLLMRHGEAVDPPSSLGDAGRWLTGKGRRHTRAVGEHLAQHGAPGTLWTSPLVRAVQTAEIVALTCGIEDDFAVVGELANGDRDALLHQAAVFKGPGPLLLVGHEPMLSDLAVRLLGRLDWPGFKKSSVCSLAWDGRGHARFGWMLLARHLELVKDLDRLR